MKIISLKILLALIIISFLSTNAFAETNVTEILGTTWTLVGNHGAAENDTVIPADSLAGMTSVQVTFNLHGTSFGEGDDEASIVFVQNGGWRAANVILAFGAQNGLDGSQTVTIPISSFHNVSDPNITLDPNQPVSNLHARFWNKGAFTVDITSVKLIPSGNPTPTPTSTSTPPEVIAALIIAFATIIAAIIGGYFGYVKRR